MRNEELEMLADRLLDKNKPNVSLFKHFKTEGSRILPLNNALFIEYLDKNGVGFGYVPVMQDIVNVENPNPKTVFVEFSDGTKEVALLSEDDQFSLETGVLICITKKLLSNKVEGFGTGSSAYNKIVKYALTKLNYKKEQKALEIEEAKKKRAAEVAEKQRQRQTEIDERERKINIIAEAFKRANNDIKENMKKDFVKEYSEFSDLFDQIVELETSKNSEDKENG